MKKQWFFWMAVVAIVMTSCDFGGKDVDPFNERDLIGYWYDTDNVTDTLCFTSDKVSDTDHPGYSWGKMWDGADDMSEADVDAEWNEEMNRHGNGWFMWKFTKTTLNELHVMTLSGSEVPRDFTITTLNATDLKMTRQNMGTKFNYKRVQK